MDQVIITAAITGAVTPKAKNAHIPITPEEIAADAYACWKAGAAMVHPVSYTHLTLPTTSRV